MILIGELVNGTQARVRCTINAREVKEMAWVARCVARGCDLPVAVDTANPEAMEAGLEAHRGEQPPMVNALSLEREGLNGFILRGRGAQRRGRVVLALPRRPPRRAPAVTAAIRRRRGAP